jgi:hypothetical protein
MIKNRVITFLFLLAFNLWINDVMAQEGCSHFVKNFLGASAQTSENKKIILHIDSDISERVFKVSKDNFLKSLESEIAGQSFEDEARGPRFQDVILALNKDDLVKEFKKSPYLYENVFKELKLIRKEAAILRSIFVVFSNKHSSPDAFEEFTKKLGKLNDVLEFKDWKAVPEASKKVKKSLNQPKILAELKGFKPSKVKGIKSQLDEVKNDILHLLKKEQLKMEEFHELRKLLKHFLVCFQVIVNIEKKNELKDSYLYLFTLNEELGAARDEILKQEVEAYKKGIKFDEKAAADLMTEDMKYKIEAFFDQLSIETK